MEEDDLTSRSNITLGTCLTLLYNYSRRLMPNQSIFYHRIFRSYHRYKSENEQIEWMTSQSTISNVMRGIEPLPSDQYQYYVLADGDDYLRADVLHYLAVVVITSKQHDTLLCTLLTLLDDCSNIAPDDKMYILQYGSGDTEDPLADLVYRLIHILIHEPI